jgi:3-hydroxyacyl-[acyl-carrier-protein] dehydratase
MSWSSVCLRFGSEHPALAGHFPNHPIIPGVLLLDEALHALERAASLQAVVAAGTYWHIASVKFHRAVQPDEALRLECSELSGGSLRLEWHAAQTLVMSAAVERRRA